MEWGDRKSINISRLTHRHQKSDHRWSKNAPPQPQPHASQESALPGGGPRGRDLLSARVPTQSQQCVLQPQGTPRAKLFFLSFTGPFMCSKGRVTLRVRARGRTAPNGCDGSDWAKPGQSQDLHLGSPCAWQGSKHLSFNRHISRELVREWSIWGLEQHAHRGQPNLLHDNTDAETTRF